jgi:hypothetical protein
MTITSSDHLINGRLGNTLFRYAALKGLAKKHNTDLKLPEWKYAKYFKGEYPIGEVKGRKIIEPVFNYIPEWPYISENENVDISGYLQSEKYWLHCENEVRSALQFQEGFKQTVRRYFDSKRVFEKSTIAISIRRGDYVGNINYELLPITFYIQALFHNFPNWRQCNLVIFSDDIPYCKVHFDCLDNVFFSENNSDIEDLCLMSQCDHFIISNSTFSWFGAYIGEKKYSKIIRPNYLFAGPLLIANDFKDFYPERWITFDHKKENGEFKKLDLKDVCFTIPVSYDHEDRKENLELCINILRKNFDTNIFVFEQGTEMHFNYLKGQEIIENYTFSSMGGKFHRTKMLNEMAKSTECPIIFNWDADVVIAPLQILESVIQLRNGADMVFPYKWAFARMPRTQWFVKIRDHEDIGMVGSTRFNGMNTNDVTSVGGAVGFRRESFIEGGMENENFISYGPEDVERWLRFKKLGYKIERSLGGALYHIDHFVGIDSSNKNMYFKANRGECERIEIMSPEELLIYVKTWPWVKSESVINN